MPGYKNRKKISITCDHWLLRFQCCWREFFWSMFTIISKFCKYCFVIDFVPGSRYRRKYSPSPTANGKSLLLLCLAFVQF